MLQRPYKGIYSGNKGRQFLQETWILELEKSVEYFVLVFISDIPNLSSLSINLSFMIPYCVQYQGVVLLNQSRG